MFDEKELEEIIQQYKSRNQSKTQKEINEMAIKIVKDIKNIVETIVSKNINDAYEYLHSHYSNYYLSSNEKSCSLNLFSDTNLFYQELYQYCNSIIKTLSEDKNKVERLQMEFTNSFAIINFSILTDLLIDIMSTIDQAYKDDIIKSDISILVDIISSKSKRISNSSTLFLCFINELKNKYNKETKDNNFVININQYFKKKAEEKLQNIKLKIVDHIKSISFKIIQEYQKDIEKKIPDAEKTNDYSEIKKILTQKKIVMNFREEIQNNSEKYKKNINELKDKCMNENILHCFDYYTQKLLESEDYKSYKKEYILNNIILPFQINEINTENNEDMNIVYNIPDNYQFQPQKKINDTFLEYYLESKKELDYPKEKNYENEIKELIDDDNFINEFFAIITSEPLNEYFQAKIRFLDEYNAKFAINKDDNDIFLGDTKFINDMKSNYDKFRNLIIIKQICYKIPAMTDSSMRIYINPIYQIKGDLKNDKIKTKSVLKSALLILLVHEFTLLLKAYESSKVEFQKKYPLTPNRDKESERSLIYYIFHIGVIKSINYEQSMIINDSSNWKDLDKMRNIFDKNNDSLLNTDNQLYFYLVDENENDDEPEFGSKNEYCFW